MSPWPCELLTWQGYVILTSPLAYTAKDSAENKMFAKWICSDWLIHESTNLSADEMRKRKWSVSRVFSKSALSAPGWLPLTAAGSPLAASLR